jgi:hypothetical protein
LGLNGERCPLICCGPYESFEPNRYGLNLATMERMKETKTSDLLNEGRIYHNPLQMHHAIVIITGSIDPET